MKRICSLLLLLAVQGCFDTLPKMNPEEMERRQDQLEAQQYDDGHLETSHMNGEKENTKDIGKSEHIISR